MVKKKIEKNNEYYREKYLRYIPTAFCPGCGNGIILNALVRALDRLVENGQLNMKNLVAVSGIGCSGWITSPYLKADTLHTTHGRAIAFATGVKLANPKLNVLVLTGDGDGAAIGGNHLIHAARRNIDMTVILVNNQVYGMTSGQTAPTTPYKAITTTTPGGNPEHPFDLAKLVEGANGSFVARTTVAHPRHIQKLIEQAITHKGFSFIEVKTTCPTYYGRRNPPKDPPSMVKQLKEITSRTDPNKIPIGVFKEEQRPTFYEQLMSIKKVKTEEE